MSSIWTIRRSATDVKLTGLCGGVARHWGIDPVLVRVGAVLLALSGGIGIVLYLAGWLLVPADGRPHSIVHDLAGPSVRKWPREAWVVIVVVTCFLAFAASGFTTPFGFGPAIVLALIWYFGYYKNRAGKGGRSPSSVSSDAPGTGSTAVIPQVSSSAPAEFRYPGPATPFTEAAELWRQRMSEVSLQGRTTPPTAPPGAPPAPPAPAQSFTPAPAPAPASPYAAAPVSAFPLYADRGTTDVRLADPPVPSAAAEHAAFLATPDPAGLYAEPDRDLAAVSSRAALGRTRSARRLRLAGLVVLGLVLAGLGVADAVGVPVSPAIYLGAALLVVGLTLVAATWFGRARGILPVGLVLLLALASMMVVNVPRDAGAWSRTVTYTTLASLPANGDQQDVGTLTVDLSALDVTRSATYRAALGGGRLEVLAPTDVDVRVTYRVDAGVVVENGEPVRSGTDMVDVLEPRAPQAGRPTLTLDLSLDVGELKVQR